MRQFTAELCAPLEVEDYVVQSMPDVSPTRWHLAHTTWFFERFLLARGESAFVPFDPHFELLFNSYYNAVGEQFPRSRRGLLTRPTVRQVHEYRQVIDERVHEWIESAGDWQLDELSAVLVLGLHHEQQHQELMLTDLKHVFSCNPLLPVYRSPMQLEGNSQRAAKPPHVDWIEFDEGVAKIGHRGAGFAYDNELPRHRAFVERRQIASHLVTNREFKDFIAADGYERPELWLSAGWAFVQENRITAPLYWRATSTGWCHFTLGGLRDVADDEPVCHVSMYEADAFARWSNARLPTEAEWELAAVSRPLAGNFVARGAYHPLAADQTGKGVCQAFGDVWEWTASPYIGYPGYSLPLGAIGEYNGKFMCNQYVLRGGSCATSDSHIRPTYRNFFPPDARWQFTGIRLAR